MIEELIRRQDYPDLATDMQVLEAQRVRLTLLEEKIKEVLAMLRSLNAMVRSSLRGLRDLKLETSDVSAEHIVQDVGQVGSGCGGQIG